MSNINIQDCKILSDNRFNEFCSVLGVKKQCCYAPEKKVIEKAFRRAALKSHPDKGGDPVVFKKLNDAYNKLIGHIQKLEQQVEAEELSNSILIEISKASVTKWQEKLNNRYGWHKSENCKNIIFEGPYKQFMGRSMNTGSLTVVLYEDPPDSIPKIHVRSKKYMAWIAENSLPVHMHVERGKSLQFDQWRIAHLAEFGINFFDATPATPAPGRPSQGGERAKERPARQTPKSKRKENSEREASERRAKTRRDSEPSKDHEKTKDASEEEIDEQNKENSKPSKYGSLFDSLSCGHCGAGFANLMEYLCHRKVCIPDEEFEQQSTKPGTSEQEHYASAKADSKTEDKVSKNIEAEGGLYWKKEEVTNSNPDNSKCEIIGDNDSFNSQSKTNAASPENLSSTLYSSQVTSSGNAGSANKTESSIRTSCLVCDKCDAVFSSMVKYDTHRTKCDGKHKMAEATIDFPMGSLRRDLPKSGKNFQGDGN